MKRAFMSSREQGSVASIALSIILLAFSSLHLYSAPRLVYARPDRYHGRIAVTWHLPAPSGEDSAGEPLATILTLHPTKFNQCFDAVVQIVLSLRGSGSWQCRPPIIDRPRRVVSATDIEPARASPRPRPSRHFGIFCLREASPRPPVDKDAGCPQHEVLPRR